jgi:1-phosphatidylinositol-3-phosphate 5-kinase
MAKIFGFYTIKYKNIHTGKTMKMDLLVMEHLFYKQTITQKFSLKGILGRPSDSRKDSDEALCDDDWVKGNYRNILMTHGHSKNIIREAIHNDTRFLAESNIVDYSLLVGVDEQRKELVIGIVGEYHDVEGFLNQWH